MTWKPVGPCGNPACGVQLFTNGASVTDTNDGVNCISWFPPLPENGRKQWEPNPHVVTAPKPVPAFPLPEEPARSSQFCGYQTSHSAYSSRYCGEKKAPGLYFCVPHDRGTREEYGEIRMAPGNSVGLDPKDTPMPTFVYDITSIASITVRAESREEADALIVDTEWDDAVELETEIAPGITLRTVAPQEVPRFIEEEK